MSYQTESKELWRNLSTKTRQRMAQEVMSSLEERSWYGRKVYGDTFQGDPIDQAWEEALDTVFYLWIERNRRKLSLDK